MAETIWLFLGLLGVLTVASAIATALSWKSTRKGDALPSTLANLNSRIKAWWIMIAAISIAFLFGKGGVILLFAFVSFAALREYVTLTHTRRGDHWILLGMFLVIIPVQYYLLWIDWYGMFAIFVPVYCFLAMPALTAISGDTARFLERVSEQQWGIMLSVYCISHVPALLTLAYTGFRGQGAAAHRLPDRHCPRQRRAAICVRKALRQEQGRAKNITLQDLGRADRRHHQRLTARSRALLAHAFHTAASRTDGRARLHHGLLRRIWSPRR